MWPVKDFSRDYFYQDVVTYLVIHPHADFVHMLATEFGSCAFEWTNAEALTKLFCKSTKDIVSVKPHPMGQTTLYH